MSLVEPASPNFPLPGGTPLQPGSPRTQPPDSPPHLQPDPEQSPSYPCGSSLLQSCSPCLQTPGSPDLQPERLVLEEHHPQQLNNSFDETTLPPVIELTPVESPTRAVSLVQEMPRLYTLSSSTEDAEPLTPVPLTVLQEMPPLYNVSSSTEDAEPVTPVPVTAVLQEGARRCTVTGATLSIDCHKEVPRAHSRRPPPLVHLPSKTPGPGSFQDLLAQLSAAHERECEALRKQLRGAAANNVDTGSRECSTSASVEGAAKLCRQPHQRSSTADCLHNLDMPVPRRSVFKATVEAEKAKLAAKQASCSIEAWQPTLPEEEQAVHPVPEDAVQNVEAFSPKKRNRTASLHRFDSGMTDLTTQTLPGSVGYRNGLTGSLFSEISSMCSDESLWQPRSVWTKEASRLVPGSIPPSSYTRAFSQYLRSLSGVDEDDKGIVTRYNGFLRHFISLPTSLWRLVWDLICAVLIFYDLIMVPLKVFDPPNTSFTDAMVWFTLVFWTCNMFASITVGYMNKGTTVMDPWKILLHYFKRWFWVDLLIVVPDWIVTCTTSQAGGVRLMKILRLVRTFRIIRIIRLRWIWAVVDDLLDSEVASIFVNIFKMIIALIAVNHVTACLWYFIAEMQDDDELTWVRVQGYEGKSWIYCYLTAFHWSITQFTPASMDVQPQNVWERLYTNVLIVIYLVGFSYLVGSITGSLTQLRSLTEEGAKQFWILRKYLRQNQVPLALSLRVQKTLEHAWQKKMERMQLQEITILRLLSDQLRDELNAAITVPHMSVHPFFEHLYQTSEVTMHRLANKAIHRKHFAQNDGLFFPGEKATHMYFIVSGTMAYTQVTKHGIQKKPHEIVGDGEDSNKRQQQEWISEQVLWIDEWTHLGALMATKESALLLVDAKVFAEILELTPPVFHIAKSYAAQYLQWVYEYLYEDLTDICTADEWAPKVSLWLQAEAETQKPALSRTRRFMDTGEFPMLPRLSGKASRASWTSVAP